MLANLLCAMNCLHGLVKLLFGGHFEAQPNSHLCKPTGLGSPAFTKWLHRDNAVGTSVMGFVLFLLLFHLSALAAFADAEQPISSASARASAQNPQASELTDLILGQSVERTLARGKTQAYRIGLQSGQYLNVTVEQLGIDVTLQLIEPGGKVIVNLNWQVSPFRESLWAVAESAGDYRLEISPSDARAEAGRYRVSLERLGSWETAPEGDRDFVTAHNLLSEGTRLYFQRTAESQRQAIEKYREALALWRKLDERFGEAFTVNNIAFVRRELGDVKGSVEDFKQALALHRAVKNPQGEVGTLNNLGTSYFRLGETQEAIAAYQQGLDLARAHGVKDEETRILRGIGLAFMRLGDTAKALAAFEQALSLTREMADRLGEASSLNNIGIVYFNLGQNRDAIAYYQQALTIFRSLASRGDEVVTLGNIGIAYSRMGEYQKAIDTSLGALQMRRAAGDRFGEATDLNNIGILYLQLGDFAKALEVSQRALQLGREVGGRQLQAISLQNLSLGYASLGELQRALEHGHEALRLTVETSARSTEAATLSILGAIYHRLADMEKSLDHFRKALTLRKSLGDQYGEASTLCSLGRAYLGLNDYPQARTAFEQALTLIRTTANRSLEPVALFGLAAVERAEQRLPKAQEWIAQALDSIEANRTQVGLSELRATYLAARQDAYEFSIDLLMQLAKQEGQPARIGEALQISERRRARTLLESLTESRADIRQGVVPELLETEHHLRERLTGKTDRQVRLLSRAHTPEEARALDEEIKALAAEYEQALAKIKLSSPRYAALTQPVPLGLEQIQAEVLDDETTLLEYSLGEERSYLWAVTNRKITAYDLPKRAIIEPLARQVYDSLAARNQRVNFETAVERQTRIAKADAEYERTSLELSRLILAPALQQTDRKRLLIVSDGALQYIPFAALPLPHESAPRSSRAGVPLVVKYEVVNLPSASALAVLRKEIAARPAPSRTLIVLADPIFASDDARVQPRQGATPATEKPEKRDSVLIQFTPDNALTRSARDLEISSTQLVFPRLPFTRREAESIARLVPATQSRVALDFNASKTTATDPELGQYRYVHFATHTLLNNTHPSLSGIVLSLVNQEAKEQDGFLVTHEIYNLKLAADLVVLSSCKTGLGKEVKGEGVVGITRSFMYAGAARVLVSLWDVDDEATAEMMQRFYQAMLARPRLRPAAALRAAQLAMWKSRNWRAPYFWAAFGLQGEYR